ncbi:hypothetical protein CDO73_22275 [Saccharibacillus sp. O23]|nr:hypothetical protein CDO73_22275 [Saccharibacillus sp. O23]
MNAPSVRVRQSLAGQAERADRALYRDKRKPKPEYREKSRFFLQTALSKPIRDPRKAFCEAFDETKSA